jgi:uncharacterized protein YndB with AHSA1/START domain
MTVPELDQILIQVTIPLPIPMIFKAFVEEKQLEQWLCDRAVVEPRMGGRYELTFSSLTIPFTTAGTVSRITTDVELGFTWKVPPQFASGLSHPDGSSEVYVRLQESPEGIDVTLEHGGWKDDDNGAEARSWHFHLWEERLETLKSYLVKAAYG